MEPFTLISIGFSVLFFLFAIGFYNNRAAFVRICDSWAERNELLKAQYDEAWEKIRALDRVIHQGDNQRSGLVNELRMCVDDYHTVVASNNTLRDLNEHLRKQLAEEKQKYDSLLIRRLSSSSGAELALQRMYSLMDRIYANPETRLTPELIDELAETLFADLKEETNLHDIDEEGNKIFYLGDRVEKTTGYAYPGIINGITITEAGKFRYTVESTAQETVGMLHIFSGQNLALKQAGAARKAQEAILIASDEIADTVEEQKDEAVVG